MRQDTGKGIILNFSDGLIFVQFLSVDHELMDKSFSYKKVGLTHFLLFFFL